MWSFRAMNTVVSVAAPGLDPASEQAFALAAERVFHETEQRFSRFLPESELSRLNRAEGPVRVSAELLALVLRARWHGAATEGVFEPAIGAALAACGYDRSFVPGALDRDAAPTAVRRARIDEIAIDEARGCISVPPEVQLDFGGFLKGLTVDRVAALVTGPVVVDAGGDAVLRGADGWAVDIEDPRDAARVLGSVRVGDGAVATSAPNRRHWRRGTQRMHHLIDPRTGMPAQTDLAQVTVLAPTAELADVMAKVAFILGRQGARHALERRGLAGVLVLANGDVCTVGPVELHHA